MKKTAVVSLFCGAVCLLNAAEAAPEAPSFREVRSAAISAKRLASLRSAKLVYRSSGKGSGTEYVMIRVRFPGEARFDISSAKESFTACLDDKGSWSSTPQGGVEPLSAAAELELFQHAAMMPIPVSNKPIFAPPARLREELEDKKLCTVYETYPLKGEKFQLLLWIDKENKLLRKAETIDQEGNHSVFQLRNYRSYNGVPLATRFYITDADGFYTLTLESALWNPDFKDVVFDRPAIGPAMPEFVPAAAVKKTAPGKKLPDTPEVKQLKKTIRILETKIAAGEERLATMEKVISSNKNDITSLTASSQQNRSRTYANKSSFRIKNYNSRTNLSSSGKKLLKQLNKDNAALIADYQELNKSVLQMKLQLGDAQDKLAAMTETKEK